MGTKKVMDFAEYAKKVKGMTPDALAFALKDAHETALIHDEMERQGISNNAGYYWDEVSMLEGEINRRKGDPVYGPNSKYRFEFSFESPSGGYLKVAINCASSYDRSVNLARYMEFLLLHSVPFKFSRTGDAKIEILGGQRVRGMLSIEIPIRAEDVESNEKIIEILTTANWMQGLEMTK